MAPFPLFLFWQSLLQRPPERNLGPLCVHLHLRNQRRLLALPQPSKHLVQHQEDDLHDVAQHLCRPRGCRHHGRRSIRKHSKHRRWLHERRIPYSLHLRSEISRKETHTSLGCQRLCKSDYRRLLFISYSSKPSVIDQSLSARHTLSISSVSSARSSFVLCPTMAFDF